MEIIKKIQKIREQKKITRKKMAEQLFISEGTYKDIEYERIRLSLENFLSICKILEISPMELLNTNQNEHFILISDDDLKHLNKIINKLNKQIITNNDNSNYFSTGDIQIGNNNNNIAIGNNTNIKDSFNKKQ